MAIIKKKSFCYSMQKVLIIAIFLLTLINDDIHFSNLKNDKNSLSILQKHLNQNFNIFVNCQKEL